MRTLLSILLSVVTLAVAHADDLSFTHRQWRVTYVEKTHAFRMQAMREGADSYSPVITNSISEARYTDQGGADHQISLADMSQVTLSAEPIEESAFGPGTCYRFLFGNADGAVRMVQRFYAYDGKDYLLTDLQLLSDAEIQSNYLAPVCSNTSYRILPASSDNRMLKVPFDNDGFQRYHRYQLSRSMTSYEVTAIYSGSDRHGLVVGSVDHDHWKSAIDVTATGDANLSQFKAYSGVSTEETRDKIPHGKLRGTSITSARFYIDFCEDFRNGLDRYAAANTLVVPKNDSWQHGTPMGWQSWGVLADKSNYTDVKEIADYYADVLQPGGFCNSQGKVIFSLDASDGLSDDERKSLCTEGVGRSQFVGNYSTPFSLWWREDEIDNYVGTINGVSYTVRDIVIKQNGVPCRYDGAWALDPTHPKVKQDIVNFVNTAAAAGIRYIKCDFVNCGIIQSDSYFKADIHTAVEAYNEGMRYLADRAAAKGIFVALSIAPLFPYQYANSRRIACDTWGTIDQTEYSMNAISSGWWTSGLYQYNDPDHVVLVGTGGQAFTSEAENRSRYTNAAITGMVLVADNFSTSNVSKRGNPSLSKSRAAKVMLNADINAIADMGVSFRPLYGCKEYQGSEDKAEHFFVHQTDRYLYVAGINYGSSNLTGSISLEDLGLGKGSVAEVKELWTGETMPVATALDYQIPYKDARVYRLTLTNTGVERVTADESTAPTEYYDLAGRKALPRSGSIYITNNHRKIIIP